MAYAICIAKQKNIKVSIPMAGASLHLNCLGIGMSPYKALFGQEHTVDFYKKYYKLKIDWHFIK